MKRLTKKEADRLVDEGVRLLNDRVPGWVQKINLDKLDLGRPACCIEGQLLGGGIDPDHFEALNQLMGIKACDYGFDLDNRYKEDDAEAGNPNWDVLTDAWLRRLRRLQKLYPPLAPAINL